MIRISLCMIVKNEEKNLPRCLESLKTLMDEMIIVDTGSSDRTKMIAESFGAKIFDYEWTNDFAAARNFAFSKAAGDYIYSADADETLTGENIEKFGLLKSALKLQEAGDSNAAAIDIVQMYYCGQLKGTERSVYNFDRELRPKLFRRMREFVWEDPIHEQVRLAPVVFDSDIEILHHPSGDHTKRDLAAFLKATERGNVFSARLLDFYARELYMAGDAQDLKNGRDFFRKVTEDGERSVEEIQKASIILVRDARLHKDVAQMMKYALKDATIKAASETCCELGDWYLENKDAAEASLWYYNAAFEQAPVLDIRTAGDRPLYGLSKCYGMSGDKEQEALYLEMAKKWKDEKGQQK